MIIVRSHRHGRIDIRAMSNEHLSNRDHAVSQLGPLVDVA